MNLWDDTREFLRSKGFGTVGDIVGSAIEHLSKERQAIYCGEHAATLKARVDEVLAADADQKDPEALKAALINVAGTCIEWYVHLFMKPQYHVQRPRAVEGSVTRGCDAP